MVVVMVGEGGTATVGVDSQTVETVVAVDCPESSYHTSCLPNV